MIERADFITIQHGDIIKAMDELTKRVGYLLAHGARFRLVRLEARAESHSGDVGYWRAELQYVIDDDSLIC